MLPRTERLTTRQFAVAFSKGRALRHALMTVRVHRRDERKGERNDEKTDDKAAYAPQVLAEISGTRAAFVVPKKVGKAVVRNRLRRRARESYRLHSARETLQNRSLDLIFLMTPNAVAASQQELTNAISDLMRRVARI